ncbi:MAG: hypothetical protein J6X35_11950 [Bacteroidales bacterium]|nr:hypothetical protein [Bacteroidales bacterium]
MNNDLKKRLKQGCRCARFLSFSENPCIFAPNYFYNEIICNYLFLNTSVAGYLCPSVLFTEEELVLASFELASLAGSCSLCRSVLGDQHHSHTPFQNVLLHINMCVSSEIGIYGGIVGLPHPGLVLERC